MKTITQNKFFFNELGSIVIGVFFTILVVYFAGSEIFGIWSKLDSSFIQIAFITILVIKCLSFIGWYLTIEKYYDKFEYVEILVYGYAITIAVSLGILDYLVYPKFSVSALYTLLVPFGWFITNKNGTLIAAFWAVLLLLLPYFWLESVPCYLEFINNRIAAIIVIIMVAIFLRFFKRTKVKLRDTNIVLNQKIIETELKSKELEQFVYTVSHDLKEPLRSLSVILDIFREGNKEVLKTEDVELLGLVKVSTLKMGRSIQSMIDYSKLGQDFNLEEVTVNKLVNDIIFELDDLLQKVDVKFEIGELGVSKVYLVDFKLLLSHLIENAILYRKPNQTLEISISRKDSTSYTEFYITDNGIGIEEVNHERIFKIFQSLEANETRKGLGLAHCSKIAKLHKGGISVQSGLGLGSTFIVKISNELVQ